MSGGCSTETKTAFASEKRLELRTGTKRNSASGSDYKPETTTLCLRCAVGKISPLGNGRIFIGKLFQAAVPRAEDPRSESARLKHLRNVFESTRLANLTADDIEMYLRQRLKQRARVKTKSGFVEKQVLKATTVHQELRVVRRMLNVAVRKKFLFANPCAGVEFPARVDGLFRPHYVPWSEQQKIEFNAPEYLRNVIRIITETGLRIYKELAPMKKDQLDLENRTVWIPDSKTPNGVAEVPLTEIAADAFRSQLVISGPGVFLFPSDENASGHQSTFKTVWHATLRRAGVPYFRIYDLRSTYATRLSAGGVADEWVTQLLRQGDAKVFKKYSQMKLQMKREALAKLNRQANERGGF